MTIIGSDRGENYNFSNGQEIREMKVRSRIRRAAIPSDLFAICLPSSFFVVTLCSSAECIRPWIDDALDQGEGRL